MLDADDQEVQSAAAGDGALDRFVPEGDRVAEVLQLVAVVGGDGRDCVCHVSVLLGVSFVNRLFIDCSLVDGLVDLLGLGHLRDVG